MRRHVAGTVLVMGTLLPWTSASTARGQIFTRLLHEEPDVPNRSCGVLGCPPQTLTYGYHHEHWRRWPEAYSLPGQDKALSPFVAPDRAVPQSTVLDPRDEGSLAPRTRTDGVTPAPARPESGAPSPPPRSPAATPAPTLPRGPATRPTPAPPPPQDGLLIPESLPTIPAEPPTGQATPAPSGDSFFPDADENLPETLPFDDAAPTPPAGGQGTPGSQGPVDTEFNPDDFGQIDPQRLRRYRNGLSTKLRPARRAVLQASNDSPSRPTAAPARGIAGDTQLVDYESSVAERHNPLRGRSSSRPLSPSATSLQPRPTAVAPVSASIAQSDAEQFEADLIDDVPEPVEMSESLDDRSAAMPFSAPVRPVGRTNPLRRG
jgi:hypothetical protein